MQPEIDKLAQLIEEEMGSIERELKNVEELYNLDCAGNFLESLVDEKSKIEDSRAKEQLLYHLREASAPPEWVELAEKIRVGAGQQLNIFEGTRGFVTIDSSGFRENKSA